MNIQALAKSIPVEGEYSLEGLDFNISGEQYLTFSLAAENYAVDILSVEEIRAWETPSKIPNAPHYVKGVINIRGIIVPIIDLRLKFSVGIDHKTGGVNYSKTTVVIVLKHKHKRVTKTMGFVVDSVSDVLNLEQEEIKKPSIIEGSVPLDYIEGLINVGNNVVTLLNVKLLQTIEPH